MELTRAMRRHAGEIMKLAAQCQALEEGVSDTDEEDLWDVPPLSRDAGSRRQ